MADLYETLNRNLYKVPPAGDDSARRTVFDIVSEGLMSGEIDLGMGLGRSVSYEGKVNQTLKASTIFETAARFHTSTDTGTATFGGGKGVSMDSGIVANKYATVELPFAGIDNNDIPVFDDTAFSAVIRIDNLNTLNGAFYVGVNDGNATLNGTSVNLSGIDQYGFKLIKSSGVATLYATSSNDDGTETTTALGTVPESETVYLAAVCEKDYRVSFTASSVSLMASATHRDNIPDSATTSDTVMTLHINNSNTAANFGVDVASYSFEKFSGGLY